MLANQATRCISHAAIAGKPAPTRDSLWESIAFVGAGLL
ncbi:hypothetical protein QF012_006009, partial [Pseudomonas laurylsulfatiphila]